VSTDVSADDLFEATLHKALGHPLRLRILELVIEHREASPLAVSRKLGQPLATVSRHMRVLRDLGFIELTRTEPRRGAVEHFYRAVQCGFIDDHTWERLSVPLRRGIVRQLFRKIFSEAAQAGRGGGFDRAGAHLDRVPLCLDEQGRAELSAALVALLEEALAIQARVDDRRGMAPKGDHQGADLEGREASILVLMHFDGMPSSRGQEAESEPPPGHLPPLLP
jgi:DNA-binding transcriptional ArsR family regulator